MSRPGPVNQPGRLARFTTMNVDEGLPGVLTPLTWTFYFPPTELAVRAAWHGLGATPASEGPIPDDPDRRFFGAIEGYSVCNLDVFGQAADRMPGGSGAALEMQIFGSSDPDRPAYPHPWRRYPFVAVKAPGALRRAMRALDPIAEETKAWWRSSIADAAAFSEPGRGAPAVAAARDRFVEILNVHLVLSMVCQGVMERVEQVAARSGIPGLGHELIKSDAGTAEFQMVADLRRLAFGEIDLDGFLGEHGYHGAKEGLVEARVWREDPAPILALAETYRGRGGESTADLAERRLREHADAVAKLERALGRARMLSARPLIRFASRTPVWRETGRASILRAVDVARAAARGAGVALAAEGTIETPDDVFFLTVDELQRVGDIDARALIAERRVDHEGFERVRLPQAWQGAPTGEGVSALVAAPAAGNGRLEGIGVSSGVAEGRVVVVHDQNEAELDEGDVLVCRVTDPSWASLFPLASAVVTDVGGPMSHAAIVCRELGVPCVANTRTGTTELSSGARVRVDGGTGVVEVLDT